MIFVVDRSMNFLSIHRVENLFENSVVDVTMECNMHYIDQDLSNYDKHKYHKDDSLLSKRCTAYWPCHSIKIPKQFQQVFLCDFENFQHDHVCPDCVEILDKMSKVEENNNGEDERCSVVNEPSTSFEMTDEEKKRNLHEVMYGEVRQHAYELVVMLLD